MPKQYSKKTLQIKSLEHLSFRLNTPAEELQQVAGSIDTLYDHWKKEKPKKKGEFREISSPRARLKIVQKKIHLLLGELNIHDSAFCGIKGRSNLSNAEKHLGCRWLFSLDFRNFFPNISHYKVYNLFLKELGCSSDVSSIMTKICTLNGGVPQGSPISMDIANLICRPIDNRLGKLSSKFGIVYSRYCDDINFSGLTIPEPFKEKVKIILPQSGFELNPDKETFCGRNQSQVVTGLCLNSEQPTIPKESEGNGVRRSIYFGNMDMRSYRMSISSTKHKIEYWGEPRMKIISVKGGVRDNYCIKGKAIRELRHKFIYKSPTYKEQL